VAHARITKRARWPRSRSVGREPPRKSNLADFAGRDGVARGLADRCRRSTGLKFTARSASQITYKSIMKLDAPVPGGEGEKSGERYLAE